MDNPNSPDSHVCAESAITKGKGLESIPARDLVGDLLVPHAVRYFLQAIAPITAKLDGLRQRLSLVGSLEPGGTPNRLGLFSTKLLGLNLWQVGGGIQISIPNSAAILVLEPLEPCLPLPPITLLRDKQRTTDGRQAGTNGPNLETSGKQKRQLMGNE